MVIGLSLTDILNAVKHLFFLARIKGVDSSLRSLRQVVGLWGMPEALSIPVVGEGRKENMPHAAGEGGHEAYILRIEKIVMSFMDW